MKGQSIHHRFTVVGRWSFPTDMMRYDNCQPATDADRDLIEKLSGDHCPNDIDIRKHYEVNLVAESHRFFEPTEDRWASFDWHVSRLNGDPTRYAVIPVANRADNSPSEITGPAAILDRFFRTLSPEEEVAFRRWARDNFEPTRPEGFKVWHPVTRDEWQKIEKEHGNG